MLLRALAKIDRRYFVERIEGTTATSRNKDMDDKHSTIDDALKLIAPWRTFYVWDGSKVPDFAVLAQIVVESSMRAPTLSIKAG